MGEGSRSVSGRESGVQVKERSIWSKCVQAGQGRERRQANADTQVINPYEREEQRMCYGRYWNLQIFEASSSR